MKQKILLKLVYSSLGKNVMIRGGGKEKMMQGVFGGFEPFKKQIILQSSQTKHSEGSPKVILDWGSIRNLQVLELEED